MRSQNKHSMKWLMTVVAGLIFSLGVSVSAVAQEEAEQEVSTTELQKQFDQSVLDLKENVKKIRRAGVMHFMVASDEAYEYREKWEKQVEAGTEIVKRINEAALAIFLRQDEPDTSVASIVGIYATQLYDEGKLEVCSKLTRKLLRLFPEDPALKNDLARVGIATNEFELAEKMVDYAMVEKYSKIEQMLFENLAILKQNAATEELINASALKEEEPRPLVKIEIRDKGYYIIELFEDEAPETVGNFISLVESGHYDGIACHPVISHLLAATGVGTMQESRLLDYTIYDEQEKPNHHFHLRGAVAMRQFGFKNSASSSFYICRVPLPNLDSADTVFGRVIEGMEVVDSIRNTATLNDKEEDEIIDGSVPDIIKKATVIRKRNHDYKPNKVIETEQQPK
ncbi:MAG: peptidylprolyl isomerase [Planctomycetota bacterium]